MKKFVSIILAVLILVSSTVAFASNGRGENKNNNSSASFQNQINEMEKQFQKYHSNESLRNSFLAQLTDLRNKLLSWDKNNKRNTLTIYLNGK
jgi:hypothetical protein